MAKTVPNFGQIVMAARNRYKWISDLRLFVKIVTPVPGVHQVNIEPPTYKPPFSYEKGGIDWQSQEGVVSLLPALQRYLGRNQPHEFYIDDDGCEIPKPQSVINMEEEAKTKAEAAAHVEEQAPPSDEYLEPVRNELPVEDKPYAPIATVEQAGPPEFVHESNFDDDNIPDPESDIPENTEKEPSGETKGRPGRRGKSKDGMLQTESKKEKSQE